MKGLTMTEKYARIDSATLGFEDHGIFGYNLVFREGANLMRGSGWYGLQNEFGGRILAKLLATLGAATWADLVGKVVLLHEDEEGKLTGVSLPYFDYGTGKVFVFGEPYGA